MDLYQATLRLLLVFPLVIILIFFGLRYFLKRFAPTFGIGRRVQVLERSALNSRTFIYVVKAGDDYLLVGTTANTVVLLKDLGPHWGENCYGDNEKGETHSGGEYPPFASLLQRLQGKTPGGPKFSGGELWLKIMSIIRKKTNKMEDEKEEFDNLPRNYKLRKVKEEEMTQKSELTRQDSE